MDSVVRPFNEKDLEACVDLYVETFARPPWSETWDRTVVRARLDQITRTPHFFGLIAEKAAQSEEAEAAREGWEAERNDVPVAFVLGYEEPWHQGSHFYLKEMCVHPDHQRQGIGSRLMESLTATLKERGAQRLYLLTSRGDLSESFYTKAGFYTSPKMILMARRLSG